MFGCSFTLAGTNNKYFCKGTCSGKDILVKTNGSKNVTQDRYSIEDNRDGVFYVTIKNLMKTDSGTYWCGVERYGLDSYQEVHLTVTDAPPTSTTSPVTSRRHVSTSLLNLSTTLPNLSTTSSNLSTTLPNLSPTSPNTSSTLPNHISGHLSRAGLMVWTSVGLVVMVTVLGLVLLLFYRQRRGTREHHQSPPTHNLTLLERLSVCTRRSETDRQTHFLWSSLQSTLLSNHLPTLQSTLLINQLLSSTPVWIYLQILESLHVLQQPVETRMIPSILQPSYPKIL
ncbi:CMRF35-like molecule 5 [Oncorhynchus keta]|uniref:CMRF35-like molecule 5 n=1 Tax=Oncorhynchus keta TaxID=8018 RepID=UPI00227C4EBD|nr:CMRF35-like molecule 5 [Oncorhynchus keta]